MVGYIFKKHRKNSPIFLESLIYSWIVVVAMVVLVGFVIMKMVIVLEEER
jgi:hypothetical protein